jgi:hypothetical protein
MELNEEQVNAINIAYLKLVDKKQSQNVGELLLKNFPFLEQEEQVPNYIWEFAREFTSDQINALNSAYLKLNGEGDNCEIEANEYMLRAFPFLRDTAKLFQTL